MAKKDNNNQEEPLEKQLWKTADILRKNIDATEYKHLVLGLTPLPKLMSGEEWVQYDKELFV